jgi:DNA helicase-2/ATP-dependent DNA helicase PcrA
MNTITTLNPEQQEAVRHTDGPLLILAGAGSGKTGTMTHRITRLITEEGVHPWNILAVTFTNKAANEMKERVERLVGDRVHMWIMTFHAVCLRIQRAHADRLGYHTDFVVYDPTDQKAVVKSCVKALDLDDRKFTPGYVLSVISDAKGKGKDAAAFAQDGTETLLRKSLADLFEAYEGMLRKNNAMDFDDLIGNTVRLFKRHPDVLEEYRRRFRYIMVDEYQDTDPQQYSFIKMLAEGHRNICVVGDDDQCIYQWRGADIRNILDFENDFKGAKVIKLEQNYRSNGSILKAANSVIGNNPSRRGKRLWTDRGDGDKIQYRSTYDEREEARFIARAISDGVAQGRDWHDFAVLYRTNAQSRTFEDALSAAQIPYRVLGGVRYYDRKEIKDVLCYMRLVQNPADNLSLERIINEPRRGIGDKTLSKMAAYAASRGIGLFEALSDEEVLGSLSARAREGVVTLVDAVKKNSAEGLRVSEIYDGLLEDTGYMHALEEQNTVESIGRIENLLEFKSVILEYETDDAQITLADFLERISLLSDIDNHNSSENAVSLMTLHSAKGLEFPVVFMPGMEDGLFPSARTVETPGGVEEERRLCYVGMTRAMEKLYLTRAKARTLYGRRDRTIESRFLKEIDTTYLDTNEQIGEDTTPFFHKAIGAEDGFASAEIFRPFDQLQQKNVGTVRKQTAQGAQGQGQSAAHFESGDAVRHPKFGEGHVLEADSRAVTVLFGSVGKKKLAADSAPLERV